MDAARIPMNEKRFILFVDDELSIRRLGQTILEHQGYGVLLAKDGEEAIELFAREQSRIGLVILDLVLPRQSGKEVLNRLRALDPKVKVIISTGRDMKIYAKLYTDLEKVEFVPKPYGLNDLVLKVRSLLDQSDHP
jgi:DNA-binding response OmpR family regulator